MNAGETLSRACGAILLAGIRFYQAVWSPLMPGTCKFHPSCSSYAAEAIAVHGPRRGLALALGRLWRCRPFTRGGVDPVPASAEEARPAPASPQLLTAGLSSRAELPLLPADKPAGAPTRASARLSESQP